MTREEEIKREALSKSNDIASEVNYKSTAAYEGFIKGAEWADKTMIYKFCERLDKVDTDGYMDSGIFQMSALIADLKEELKGE